MAIATASGVSAYQQIAKAALDKSAGVAASGGGEGFAALLDSVMQGTVTAGAAAEKQALAGLSGKANLVDVVTAVDQAGLALETMIAMRDRMMTAYQEIMRMPI